MCVNSAHLRVGTTYDNDADARAKGHVQHFSKRVRTGRIGETPYWEPREPTLPEIRDIRIALFTGQSTVYKLATIYGFSRATIARIRGFKEPITASEHWRKRYR